MQFHWRETGTSMCIFIRNSRNMHLDNFKSSRPLKSNTQSDPIPWHLGKVLCQNFTHWNLHQKTCQNIQKSYVPRTLTQILCLTWRSISSNWNIVSSPTLIQQAHTSSAELKRKKKMLMRLPLLMFNAFGFPSFLRFSFKPRHVVTYIRNLQF